MYRVWTLEARLCILHTYLTKLLMYMHAFLTVSAAQAGSECFVQTHVYTYCILLCIHMYKG